jgi:uncharacterized membrane protein YjfL (UPF0719 family)
VSATVLSGEQNINIRTAQWGCEMRLLFWIGLLVLVLGVLAFVVPVPHQETHGIRIGDASVAIQTRGSERLPLWVGGLLVVAGSLMMVGGGRKT